MKTLTACDENRLRDYLRGDLVEREEAELIAHLDSCEVCRARLEETAGGSGWCTEVQSILAAAEPFDGGASTILFPVRSGSDVHDEEHAAESAGIAEQALASLKSVLGPTDNPDMLGRIAAYEVVGIIGRGATGLVVKAFQPSLNRFVAIKILSPELAANAAARQRFAREAQAAAAVVNEHVVPIYAVEEYQGTPFLVMQFVSGGSLEHRLRAERQLSVEAALRIGMQIATGLTAAHSQGLVHRDIKPANILLNQGVERVLITDFGLARAVDDATLTHSGFVAGTPQFMSPEQARGESVDHRTDLFSLGVVLYTLLAGRPPFRAETTYGVLRRVCDELHRPLSEVCPELPYWVSHLVDHFLEKEPERRISSAADAAILLAGCLAHLQNPTSCALPREVRDTRSRKLARVFQRPRTRIGVLLVLGAVTMSLAWLGRPAAHRPLAAVEVAVAPASERITAAEQSARASASVSVIMVPESLNHVWRKFAPTDDLEREISSLKHDLQALERKIGHRGVSFGDQWRADLVETVHRMQRIEGEIILEVPMNPSPSPEPCSSQPAADRPKSPMASNRMMPPQPGFGTAL